MRGLVLEGMGVAVLAFLYLTIQTAPPSLPPPESQAIASKLQVLTHKPATIGFASRWQELKQQVTFPVAQPGVLGTTQ